jgi:hypothetical protein
MKSVHGSNPLATVTARTMPNLQSQQMLFSRDFSNSKVDRDQRLYGFRSVQCSQSERNGVNRLTEMLMDPTT